MSKRHEIVKHLADGCYHSGTQIGEALGISRAAVCKHVRVLAGNGVAIHRARGRGYRLGAPFCPLDGRRILAHLAPDGIACEWKLFVTDEVDSTSSYLLRLADASQEVAAGAVCVAEVQSRGRGRRGRSWVATPYSNIMLSQMCHLEGGPSRLGGLSLAAGVALVEALKDFGIEGVGLKWPNDLMWGGRKLGGLLADVRGEAQGPSLVVLGLGINAHIGERDAARIDQPWVDLGGITGEVVDRNKLVALILRRLREMIRLFEAEGFEGFRQDWERNHLFTGRHVCLLQGEETYSGHVQGVDRDGALVLVDDTGNRRVFHGAEISMRLSP